MKESRSQGEDEVGVVEEDGGRVQ
ncbi:hypothetical protein HaLaN_25372, partial [Haematococcus lacustris]